MIFLSSKGHGEGVKSDASVEDSVLACTAELISKQPEKNQTQLVHQLAGYMAAPDILGGKAEDLATKLQIQLAMIQKHPWIKHTSVTVAKPQQTIPDHGVDVSALDEPTLTQTAIDASSLDNATPAPRTKIDAATIDATKRGVLINAAPTHAAMGV